MNYLGMKRIASAVAMKDKTEWFKARTRSTGGGGERREIDPSVAWSIEYMP